MTVQGKNVSKGAFNIFFLKFYFTLVELVYNVPFSSLNLSLTGWAGKKYVYTYANLSSELLLKDIEF